MQNINFDLSEAILQILAADYRKDYTLEELTEIVLPYFDSKTDFCAKELQEKNNQAKVLDAILFLEKRGLTVLNAVNDECCITIKGFIVSGLNLFNPS